MNSTNNRYNKVKKIIINAFLVIILGSSAYALDPPTQEQIEKYKMDGTYEQRIEKARSYGNHLVSPYLIKRFINSIKMKNGIISEKMLAPPPRWVGMPTKGNVRIPVLLISFANIENVNSKSTIQNKIFGKGSQDEYPLESLKEFYLRSSYGKLNISGNILGWYKYPSAREEIPENTQGQEALIRDALNYYDQKGHDFSQYDNDNDGDIDYLVVIWSGKHGSWSSFWWAYQTSFYDSDFKVDGKSLSIYSWQWESYRYPTDEFTPSTLIHETGHALGLPDLYDYKNGTGPDGGVGGLDVMDDIWGDHNSFSKYLMEWSVPEILNSGLKDLSFNPSHTSGESLIIMPDIPDQAQFGEFYMVENRNRGGNDVKLPNDGLLIWHIDSTLDKNGYGFLFDNSYTDHKYIRLMEADGLEEIESMEPADSDDFYTQGSVFGPGANPNSSNYNGYNTGIFIKNIFADDKKITFSAGIDIPIRIDLTGSRKIENAWIIKNHYGDFTFTFEKLREVDVSEFVVQRKKALAEGASGLMGTYEDLIHVGFNEVTGNSFSFKDKNLEKGFRYKYKVIVFDLMGNVIGLSREIEI